LNRDSERIPRSLLQGVFNPIRWLCEEYSKFNFIENLLSTVMAFAPRRSACEGKLKGHFLNSGKNTAAYNKQIMGPIVKKILHMIRLW